MTVSAPADELKKDYDTVVNLFVQNSKLRGFRKGKAPVALVEKQYAGAIEQELRDRLLPRYYNEALQEQELKPVAVVDIQDVVISRDNGFSFKAVLDVAPEFKLPKYKKIPLKREPVAVTDDDVENTIKNIRERYARFEDVSDKPFAAGDMVQIDYEAVCDGKPLAELATDSKDIGQGEDMWVPSGEHEFVPGMTEALEGAKIGDSVTFDVEFPEDYRVESVAGLKAVYTMKIKAIRTMTLPQLNEEFLKQFDVETEEQLRENIRKDLEDAAEARETAALKEAISKHLIEKTKIEVPESIVARETESLIRETMERALRQGATSETLREHHAEIITSASESAVNRVKLSYIVNAICDAEEIEVTDEDVEKELENMSRRYGMPVDSIRTELEKRDEGLGGLRADILGNKVMDFLLENAKIKE